MGTVPVGRKKRAEATGGPQVFRSPTAVIVWWVWVLFAVANLIDLAVQGRDRLSLVAAAILVLVTGIAYVTAQRPRVIADSAGITIVNPLRDHHIGWAGVTQVDLADLLRVHARRGPDDTKVIYSWAVHYSRRRKAAAEVKARRTAARMSSGRSSFGTFGLGAGCTAAPAAATRVRERRGRRNRLIGRGGSRTDRPGAQRVRDRGPGRDGLGRGHRPDRRRRPGSRKRARRPRRRADGPADGPADGTADLRVTGWLEPLKSTWNRTALLALLIPALILLVIAVV